MDHDGGGRSGDVVVPRRHRHGDIFMWHSDKIGHLAAGIAGLQQGLDDRRKVGAAVGEDVANALIIKGGKISFGDRLAGFCAGIHD